MTDRTQTSDFEFCEKYLAKVSRTFAINIKVLKGESYKGILLAYLFCRIADTVEDDPFFSADFKAKKLIEYADLFPPQSDCKDRIKNFLRDISFQEKTDSTNLLIDMKRVFNEFSLLTDNTISIISKHVKEMASGMADFQKKVSSEKVAFLENQPELERYCYFVAGTVGLMITSVFSENSNTITPMIREKLNKNSVAFGLGLQITNIAKDFFTDYRRGWCYVPRSFFTEEGIDPTHDSLGDKLESFSNVRRRLTDLALTYLDRGLLYTLDIPKNLIRYRLFCLWPLFMAVETLARLSEEQDILKNQIIKISRKDVKRIVRNTSLLVMSNKGLNKMYENTKGRIK